MAYLKGENRAKRYSVGRDSRQATRSFTVISEAKDESEAVIIAAAGVDYGDTHPKSPLIFALDYEASQDAVAWWKWTVTVQYARPNFENPEDNPDDNPLLRAPKISYDTETIMVAARGEVDSDGKTVKAILTSAGEPYDPHPEEELEILVIQITRWETPVFSLSAYYDFQNSANSNVFTFGDLVIPEGYAKARLRIGTTETWLPPSGNSLVGFRQFDYMLAINPLGWDLELLDFGTYYKTGSVVTKFITEKKEFGLLDGSGGKLADGAPEVFNFWKSKKRRSFVGLNLPAGP